MLSMKVDTTEARTIRGSNTPREALGENRFDACDLAIMEWSRNPRPENNQAQKSSLQNRAKKSSFGIL